jgi:hypothetical protein
VAARLDVPVTGTQGDLLQKAHGWQVSTGYRWQKSDRHYVGSEYQADRDADSSQVVNKINLLDVGVRYNFTDRTSVSVGLPYFLASRSNPIRDQTRTVIDRSVTHSSSISDMVVTTRRWMRDPDSCKGGNFSLGLGIKMPTGASNHTDVRSTFVNGAIVSSVQPVDQSIQPGDGGVGFLVEGTGFKRLGARVIGYASGTYLFNPKQESGTDRGGNDPNTRYLSVSDQYLARVGAAWSKQAWTAALGGRLEGVPADDLIGGSRGFRRPGYAISVEPSLTFRHGRGAFTAGVPIAVYRNRTRSYADKINGGHGDAAFADYIVILGLSRSF